MKDAADKTRAPGSAPPPRKDLTEKRLLTITAAVQRLESQVAALVRNELIDEDLVTPSQRLLQRRFGLHSQFGEDGIVLALHAMMEPGSRRFVEIGSGPNGGNSGALAAELGWHGLMIDASDAEVAQARELNPATVTSAAAFITAENVNDVLRSHGFEGPIDQLGIDIDGNDYWIWAALEAVEPRLVVVEYNSAFGPDHAVTVPYDPAFTRPAERGVNGAYYGASLRAFCDLAATRGYRLVAVEPTGANAFFLREGLLPELPGLDAAQAYRSMPKHRPVMRQGDVVVALEAAGRRLVTPGASGPPDAHRRAAVLARRQLFLGLREHTPLAGADTDVGRFVFSTHDETVGQLLFSKGGRIEFAVLRRALGVLEGEGRSDRQTLLDVGANIGTTTVAALTTHGFERVVAFEPEPENCRLLAANAALNDVLERVIVRRVAVSDREHEIELAIDPANSGGHEILAPGGTLIGGGAPAGRIAVPAVRLDDELRRVGVDAADVSLLWLDVQGHEPAVLAGAQRLLATGVPVVAEVVLDRAAGDDGERLVEQLAPHYTRFLDLRGPKDRGPGPLADIWGVTGSADPPARPFTDILFLP